MATKAKATALVDAMSEAQLIAVDAVIEANPECSAADVLAAMVEGLANQADAEIEKAKREHAIKLAALSSPEMESALTVGIVAARASKRSWEYVADRFLLAGFVSTDLDTPTKQSPATAEYLAIRAAVIRYGYSQKLEGTDRLIVQEAINAPARQRVLYTEDVRAIAKHAVEEEIPDFLRAIKKAMKKSEDRGPKSAPLTTGERLIADMEDWLSTLRKADEKKLDFNVVDVIGALKDVIIAVNGD
jgi:hypothetical protein